MLALRRASLLHRGSWALALALLFSSALAPAVRAQEPGADIGHGPMALPAADELPVLVADRERTIRAHASLGYGYTEDVLGARDAHHRSEMKLALSYRLIEAVALAARLDGRLAVHTGDDGGDEGFVSQAWLVARAEHGLSPSVQIGAEAALRFPGGSEPARSFEAFSPELRGLLTVAPAGSSTWVSGALGFRLDRARYGAADPERLSLADRVGLGASDANALLLGLGAVHQLGAFALLGEWTWDVQVGSRAAAPLESPMRVTLGARWFLNPSLHLQLLAGVSPSGRPAIAADEPLYPIEPRVFGAFGVGVRFGASREAPARAVEPAPPPPPPPPPLAPPAPPTVRRVSGRVVDGASHTPIAGAAITTAEGVSAATDATGLFALENVPMGFVELRVSGEGFKDAVVPVGAGAEQAENLEIELEPDGTTALIRGSVSNFQGRVVAGHVLVRPGGFRAVLDTSGSFEIEVPAGEYTVLVKASGYGLQERQVRVERGDVAVIVVQLQAER